MRVVGTVFRKHGVEKSSVLLLYGFCFFAEYENERILFILLVIPVIPDYRLELKF